MANDDETTYHLGVPAERRWGTGKLVEDYMSMAGAASPVLPASISLIEYNHDCSFDARVAHARVNVKPGPVLLLDPVQQKSAADLRSRLQGRFIVETRSPGDIATLTTDLAELRALHEDGNPRMPLDVGIALLLLRKLHRAGKWSGANTKSYMWLSDLHKGRGFNPEWQSRLGIVIPALTEARYIKPKPSQGKKKYALNPDEREAIMTALENRLFPVELNRRLAKNATTLSARDLDVLNEFEDEPSDISEE